MKFYFILFTSLPTSIRSKICPFEKSHVWSCSPDYEHEWTFISYSVRMHYIVYVTYVFRSHVSCTFSSYAALVPQRSYHCFYWNDRLMIIRIWPWECNTGISARRCPPPSVVSLRHDTHIQDKDRKQQCSLDCIGKAKINTYSSFPNQLVF